MGRFALRSAAGGAIVALGIMAVVVGRILYAVTVQHHWDQFRELAGR